MQTDLALWFFAVLATLLYGVAVIAEIAFPLARRDEARGQAVEQREFSRDEESGSAHLRLEADAGPPSAVKQLLLDPGRFLTALLALKTLSLVILSVAVARLMPVTWDVGEYIGAGLGLGLAVLVGNAGARNWVWSRAAGVADQLARPTSLVIALLTPLTWLMRAIEGRNRAEDDQSLPDDILLSENGLRLLLGINGDEEPILESEKEMIASILEMDDTAAREVMVPRMDMVTLHVETSLPGALDVIMEAGHSRIPVYEENVDKVVGILYAKDLLRCYRENRVDTQIRSLLRPAYFVPLSKKVNVLLRDMQKQRVHIAMVVDEYGGIAGLVTIEDILEEIVGDIQDEYDQGEEAYVEQAGPETYLLNSRLDLYSLAKLLDIEVDDEDADTLGGMIYSMLGHVPAQGETVEIDGWQFTVLGVDGNRIDQVRAERIAVSESSLLEAGVAVPESDEFEVQEPEADTVSHSQAGNRPSDDVQQPMNGFADSERKQPRAAYDPAQQATGEATSEPANMPASERVANGNYLIGASTRHKTKGDA